MNTTTPGGRLDVGLAEEQLAELDTALAELQARRDTLADEIQAERDRALAEMAGGLARTHDWISSPVGLIKCQHPQCRTRVGPHSIRTGQVPECPSACRQHLWHEITMDVSGDQSSCLFCGTVYLTTAEPEAGDGNTAGRRSDDVADTQPCPGGDL